MNPVSPSDSHGSSTRPYLIRALHEWCTDNGFTPYLAVHVDGTVQVPMEYVKNNEIVLNVGFEATSGLKLGNEFVEFKARFGGVAREILVPIDHVLAIYARENGQGMAFPMPLAGAAAGPAPAQPERIVPGLRLAGSEPPAGRAQQHGPDARPVPAAPVSEGDDSEPPPTAPRPTLKRIK